MSDPCEGCKRIEHRVERLEEEVERLRTAKHDIYAKLNNLLQMLQALEKQLKEVAGLPARMNKMELRVDVVVLAAVLLAELARRLI